MKGTRMVRLALVALLVAAGFFAPRSADAGYWSTTVWHGGPVYYGPPVYAWAPGRYGYVARGWGYGRPVKYVYPYRRPYYAVVPRSDWVKWDASPPAAIAPAPRISRVPVERFCREYQREVTIAGRREQAYGTACLQPNGSWEIVNENLEPR